MVSKCWLGLLAICNVKGIQNETFKMKSIKWSMGKIIESILPAALSQSSRHISVKTVLMIKLLLWSLMILPALLNAASTVTVDAGTANMSCAIAARTGYFALQKNTLPWWYVFVTVGRVFCHACTSMTILWQNQDSHTCAVIEVFHDITKIIITEVSTSMTINRASQKCFRQGWPTRGIHRNGTPLSYRVRFWIR